MDKRKLGSPMMLLWPWRKAKVAGRGKHTDATKTSHRDIPPLPLEIVDRILREVCEWPLRGAERQMLTACALVCKSWLSLARRLLYHSLTVESSRAYASRKPGTLGPEALLHRSHLLGFIRSLSIRVIDESTATLPLFSDVPQGSQECVRIPDFLSLLTHTPRLRDLHLSVDWAHKNTHSFEPHVLGWLSSLELPIEVLDLKYGRPFDSPLVYDLVGIWPTIRALRVLTGYSGLPPELSSLSLRELRLPITSLATLIGWLLPHPPPNEPSNLQFLELYEISEEARAVLSVHGPSVSTLTLTRQPAFGIAHLFTKLEELVIAGPFWSSPLPAFPRTLKHIRLQVHAFMSDDVSAAIAQVLPILLDLRVITIEETLTHDKHYSDLQEACETHRVEILVNSVDLSGRTHPYLVEMERFPRQYTFSDFFDITTGDRRL
ncbi:hypothetical protein EDB86DRAFT_315083 [Lactarius hatsudake]|nr:hypothetical protein EDB86DRAFT_315083 [Lactarius hatsudake]